MTDTELDEMLDEWDVPPEPASLRQSVHAEFAAGQRRQKESGWPMRWLVWLVPGSAGRLFGGAVIGSVVFLLAMIQFSPQAFGTGSPPAHIPWTADSELIRYAGDGSSSVEMYMTSYEFNSNEVLLSRSAPRNLFMTAVDRTLDAGLPVPGRLTAPFLSPDTLEKLKRARAQTVGLISGCSDVGCLTLEHYSFTKGNDCLAGEIVGRETMLNHPIEAVRKRWLDGRMTVWTAPDLDCFALKVTYEERQSDGTFKPVRSKQAMKITVNP